MENTLIECLISNISDAPVYVNLKGTNSSDDLTQIYPRSGFRCRVSKKVFDVVRIKHKGQLSIRQILR